MKKLQLMSAALIILTMLAGPQAVQAHTGTNTGKDTGADTGMNLMGEPSTSVGTPAPGNPPGNSQMLNRTNPDTGIYSNTGNVYDTTRVHGPNPTVTPNTYRMQSTTTLDPNMGKTAPYPTVNTPKPNNYGIGKYNMNGYQMRAAANRNNINWGWLGLLGLFGLAGLRSRGRDRDEAK
ncbi:WGxxGxxG family protein [Paenibacillus contaminans]|uniref:WGxxGxxG-CTERM domain-containing protein n=1 Tax=Paenibacillus contaminans TaxID=450362 RepID=A0A329MNI0_9BACL|nr:WGxxGxxG family protein [Paenibacillus contaminans]RAV21172.1 hypothetical protein DQG23_10940 [Paenibacillus contaminans]